MSSNRAITTEADERASSRRTVAWLALLGLLLALAWIWWPGCRTYPEVTSRESLDLVKALYSACNARNAEWLAKVEKEVNELSQDGKMSPQEQQSFRRIIALAKSGQWDEAQQASLTFAEDQVRR